MSYRAAGLAVVLSLHSLSPTLIGAPQVEEAARTPIVVPGIAGAVEAAVGAHIYYVLLKDGTVMAWGMNNAGQLGNGRLGQLPGSEPGKTTPFVVEGKAALIPGLTDVRAIAAGNDHALAVKSDGSVWGWGSNGDDQLALGKSKHGPNPTPVRIPGVSRATAVAAFSAASYALLEDGTVVGWGDKLWRAGTRFISSDKPLPVPGLANVAAIRAGLPCLALLRDGSVMTWGWGFLGEGSPSQQDYAATVVPQPAKVSGIDDAVAIAAGDSTSAVIRRDGSVWIWGNGDSGHLGLGKPPSGGARPQDQLVPVKMPNVPKAVDVALGAGNTIVFEDGTMRTWGDMRLGATGRPGIERVYGPSPVAGVKDLVRVSSRAYGNLGLTRDGRVLAWGSVYVARQ
jgi:alpha-tubulin suppressor-like RCC1 family protein